MDQIQWTGNNKQAIVDFCGTNKVRFKTKIYYNTSLLEQLNIPYELFLHQELMPDLYVPLGYYIIKDEKDNLIVDNKKKSF